MLTKKERKVAKIYGTNEASENFASYKANAMRVIRDMYGLGSKSGQIMVEKIRECTTIPQINNVLAWGRKNLL